jgi:hypothetical protein
LSPVAADDPRQRGKADQLQQQFGDLLCRRPIGNNDAYSIVAAFSATALARKSLFALAGQVAEFLKVAAHPGPQDRLTIFLIEADQHPAHPLKIGMDTTIGSVVRPTPGADVTLSHSAPVPLRNLLAPPPKRHQNEKAALGRPLSLGSRR